MAKPRIVTMQQVAEAVRLSRAAVSLALRKHPSIPPATQSRVAETALRLGYRSNPLVSALMSYHLQIKGNSPRLALAYVTCHPPAEPWRDYRAYVEMFEGARQRAAALGCKLEEFSLGSARMSAPRMLRILKARGVRGILAAPLPGDRTVFPLDIREFAVVGMGMSVQEPAIVRIGCDHYQCARLAVHRSAELGYRRIGFAISAEMSTRLEHRLLAGYRQGLFDLGVKRAVPPLMPPRTATFASYLGDWCRREKPDVVIFGTFDESCQRAIPVEVGLVVNRVSAPGSPLTGIFQNERQVGAFAVEQLLQQLQHNATGPIDQPRAYHFHGQWNVGDTAPGPGRNRRAFVVDAVPA